MPATARWSSRATLIARRLVASRACSSSAVRWPAHRGRAAAAELLGELAFGEQAHRTQAAAVPVPDMRDRPASQIQPKPQVILSGRIGDEHQARHSRLEDQSVAAIQPEDDPLAQAANVGDRPADEPLRQRRGRGSIRIGRRMHGSFTAAAIWLPAMAAMPRRIVSTSGSSGMPQFTRCAGNQQVWSTRNSLNRHVYNCKKSDQTSHAQKK